MADDYPGVSAAASGVSAAADFGISYGLNAMAASKAHDRTKNFATRHWQYEQIALEEAGINPGYIFAGKGAGGGGGQGGARQAQMQHATKSPDTAGAVQKGQHARLMNEQLQKVTSEKALVDIQRKIAETELPEKQETARFFMTPDGKKLAHAIAIERANPRNIWGVGNQALRGSKPGGGMPPEIEALLSSAAGVPASVFSWLKKTFPEYFSHPGRNQPQGGQ